MKVFALTGGAGCGKSFVAHVIAEEFGFPVLDCDSITKSLYEPGEVIYKEVVDFLGDEILNDDLTINRQKMAELLFEDKNKLLEINNITHPPTINCVLDRIEEYKDSGFEYVFVESAIAVKAGFDKFCDAFLVVECDEEDRVKRLKNFRNYSDEKIQNIKISQQSSFDSVTKPVYYITNNDSTSINDIKEQIKRLLT